MNIQEKFKEPQQFLSRGLFKQKVGKVRRLTLMLTEVCNLDCWMCDFAKSKKLTKLLSLSPEALVELLQHSVFQGSLQTLTFTGGEPFANPNIKSYYKFISNAYPEIRCNFSTNCTLLPKMLPVFDLVTDWNKVGMLVSIDGIEKHSLQRGKEGSFEKTFSNLEAMRTRYPQLSITLKFTITPVNCDELFKTYDYFTKLGYRFTVKMLEYNPFYTNKLAVKNEQKDDTSFTLEQLSDVEKQLKLILKSIPKDGSKFRAREIKEVFNSLDANWVRKKRCVTPRESMFLDCDLNVFTCKEYKAVLNLDNESLDQLYDSSQYDIIHQHEKNNTGECTRCTSQMKRTATTGQWLSYLASLI